MSLGSRIVKGGRARCHVSASLSPTPREPLFFLYPQWIRTAATATEGPTASVGEQLCSLPNYSRNFHRESQRLSDGKEVPVQSSSNPGKLSITYTKSNPPSLEPQVIKTQSTACDTKDENSRRSERHISVAENLRQKDTDGPARRVPARAVQSAEERAARIIYERRVREYYQESKSKRRGTDVPDWQQVLTILQNHTQEQSPTWRYHALRIKVPSSAVWRLLFSEDENIWAIKTRCGCDIELSASRKDDGRYRALLLSGPIASVSKAAAEILHVAPGSAPERQALQQRPLMFNTKAPSQSLSSQSDGNTPTTTRYVRADERARMATSIRADKVTRPLIWTSASFGMYVQHLTTLNISPHVHGILYRRGENHVEIVVGMLCALFRDPGCKGVISTTAFNDAIAYLVKHNKIGQAKALFDILETQKLGMSTETFNIMLRGAAKNFQGFRSVLGMMLRGGYHPNGDTWLAFMNVLESFQMKLQVLSAMQQKGLLRDRRVQKAVCDHLVGEEIHSSIDNEMSQDQFVKHMVNRYGEDWLTISIANRILHALSSRGLIQHCFDFLEFMHSQHIKANSVSINTILHQCEQQHKDSAAVELIHHTFSLSGLTPDDAIYQTLFKIAWKSRLYCVARVVWRYACLDAATSFRMRKRVSDSVRTALADPTHPLTDSIRGRWNATAGAFILGLPVSSSPLTDPLTLPIHGPELLPPSPLFPPSSAARSSISPNPSASPVASEPPNPPTKKALVVAAIRRHLRLFEDWTPVRPFADVLTEAFKIDREWTTGEARYSERAIEWLGDRAVGVLVRRKAAMQGEKREAMWK